MIILVLFLDRSAILFYFILLFYKQRDGCKLNILRPVLVSTPEIFDLITFFAKYGTNKKEKCRIGEEKKNAFEIFDYFTH